MDEQSTPSDMECCCHAGGQPFCRSRWQAASARRDASTVPARGGRSAPTVATCRRRRQSRLYDKSWQVPTTTDNTDLITPPKGAKFLEMATGKWTVMASLESPYGRDSNGSELWWGYNMMGGFEIILLTRPS